MGLRRAKAHHLAGGCLYRLNGRERGICIEYAGWSPLQVEGNVLEALVGKAFEGSAGVC